MLLLRKKSFNYQTISVAKQSNNGSAYELKQQWLRYIRT